MANTKLSKLRSKLRAEMRKDRLGRVWNDEDCNNALGEGIFEVQNFGNFKWPENRVILPTFSSVASQQAYDLPEDFQSLDLVKYSTRDLKSADFIELNTVYRVMPTGTPSWYSIFEDKLQLTPIPTGVQDIDIIYRKFLTVPTEDSDLSPFPFNFDRAIILFAAYALLTQPGDGKNYGSAQIKYEKRYKKEVSKLFNTYLLPDRNQLTYKTNYVSRSARFPNHSRRRFINL